ncbi:MAG: glycosyltransferase family 4 protein, partial [Acidobacteria bacterium]|nr:glycosyltransferase family 4 protein [Acidobacteriota bacterium]
SIGSGHEIVVFTNRETGSLGPRSVQLPVWAVNRPARILHEQFNLPFLLRRERIDVLLNPGFTAPLLVSLPQVTVFHDLQHKRHPEYFRWFDLPFWRFFLWAAAHKSRRLIAVSEATRDDLIRFYRLPAAKIDVVHHGVEQAFFDMPGGREHGGYLLCASTTHPHKNHDRLLAAFARLRAERPAARLVLTGVRGFSAGRVTDLIAGLNLGGSVDLKGWVSREELYELFRGASGFIYPSLFEGFGMPVIEALAAGLPVACSNIEPLRGIAAGTALLFDPEREDSILDALRALHDGRAPSGGRERAAQFTWHGAAGQTIAALELAYRK